MAQSGLTKCWDLSCVDSLYQLSFLSSLTAATSYIFVPSVVVTHALGLVAHLPKSAKAHHILRGPWEGGRQPPYATTIHTHFCETLTRVRGAGRHHLIFQMVAWVSPGTLSCI